MRPIIRPCGTRAAYARGCRCVDCRKATRDYHREQRRGAAPDTYLPVGPPPPGEWVDEAACRGVDTNGFFPAKGANPTNLRAICGGCSVRRECLQWALDVGIDDGFWGGKTVRERRLLRTQPDLWDEPNSRPVHTIPVRRAL